MASSPLPPDKRTQLTTSIRLARSRIDFLRDEMAKEVDRLADLQEELVELERPEDEMDGDLGGGAERVPKPR